MPTYLVERYLPGRNRVWLEAALARLRRQGTRAAHLGSTYVAEDDSCFCRFEAETADDVRDANEIAGVPFVIPYAKTCVVATGHCVGTAGSGGTFEMQVTSFRSTGEAAQLTVTESVTVGDISFTAEMSGHASPAGFVVLNGTVTAGSFAGAQVHQRSNLVGGNATTAALTRELPPIPASA